MFTDTTLRLEWDICLLAKAIHSYIWISHLLPYLVVQDWFMHNCYTMFEQNTNCKISVIILILKKKFILVCFNLLGLLSPASFHSTNMMDPLLFVWGVVAISHKLCALWRYDIVMHLSMWLYFSCISFIAISFSETPLLYFLFHMVSIT